MQQEIPSTQPVRSQASVGDLEHLYRVGFHSYLRVAEGITADAESALDAVQEGFASALQHRTKFRGEAMLSTWVWRCVVNAARSCSHRHAAAFEPELADLRAQPEQVRSELHPVISALPERQRLAIFLRYYADLDYNAIADVLGIRVGTVGATLNKAHAALRARLEEVSQ